MGNLLKVARGAVISIAVFVIISLFFGVLLRFTAVPERYGMVYLMLALSAACAFMGVYTGNLFGKRGLATGVVSSALLLCIIIAIVSLCLSVKVSNIFRFWYIAPVVFGAIFGIIGANLKN